MQYPLLNTSRHAARLCLLSALAIGTGCGDDVTSTETQSPSTGSTSSDSTTTTTTAGPTTEQADSSTTTTVDPDTSTTVSTVDPDSSSTAVDPTLDTDETRGDSSSGGETPTTSTGEASSSSTGMEVAQDCPYGDLTAPDLVSGNTLDQDSEFATSCGGGGAPDVSYLLTAPADGFYVITAASPGGAIDPIIAVFDGDCGGPELSCNNGDGSESEIGVQLTEGQVVTVVADGFALTGGPVDITVTFFAGSCPDDDIGNTVPAVFNGDTTMSDNTVFGSCGGDTGLDDTLTFTAPEDGVYAINTEGSAFDTILYIRDECDGNELACNDNVEGGVTSAANLALTAGQQIVVAVDGAGLESGAYTVNIDRDECPDEVLPSTVPQTVSGSTVGEIDASFGSCGGQGAPGYSYSFTAPSAGVYTIDTANSNFDTILYAIDACGGADTQCSNDAGVGTDSRLNATLAEGEEFLFVVDGANGESGTYDIVIAIDECPDFDLGSTAPTVATGNNEADLNSSTGSCGGGSGLDAAYTFTAPSTGTYLFDTNGSDYDTVLYAFDGATCAADGTLDCDDDGGDGVQSQISVNMVADQEITLVVDGFGAGSTGDYTLNVTPIICGDGTIDFGESCDSDDLDGATCASLGFGGAGLGCDDVTCGYDVDTCDTCETETVEGTDVCDGTALGQSRCEDFGFVGGALDCNDGCTANTDQCSDNVVVVCSSPDAELSSTIPTTTDTITVTDVGTIADVDVFIDATHTFGGDLDISLIADDLSLTNDLSLDSCGGSNDVWAFFNDEGTSPVGTVCQEPFGIEGNLTPTSALSVYDGEDAAGSWTLSITDDAGGDNGTLNEWCIYITLE